METSPLALGKIRTMEGTGTMGIKIRSEITLRRGRSKKDKVEMSNIKRGPVQSIEPFILRVSPLSLPFLSAFASISSLIQSMRSSLLLTAK